MNQRHKLQLPTPAGLKPTGVRFSMCRTYLGLQGAMLHVHAPRSMLWFARKFVPMLLVVFITIIMTVYALALMSRQDGGILQLCGKRG